jgi:hypothetical protein
MTHSGLRSSTIELFVTALLKISIGVIVAFIVTTDFASAETAWLALQRFGLTGLWAYFCDRPATRINYFETYAGGPDGLARREVDRGIEIPTALSLVSDVQMISPFVLKARIRNSDPNWGPLNNLSYEVILMKEEDPATKEISRMRFLRVTRSDGKILARDGKYFDNGQPTAWEYKCRTPMSATSQNPSS